MKIRPVAVNVFPPDVQRDMTKLIFAFRNSVNATEKRNCYRVTDLNNCSVQAYYSRPQNPHGTHLGSDVGRYDAQQQLFLLLLFTLQFDP